MEKCELLVYEVDFGGDDGESRDTVAWLSVISLSERTNAHIQSESKPKEVFQSVSVYPGGVWFVLCNTPEEEVDDVTLLSCQSSHSKVKYNEKLTSQTFFLHSLSPKVHLSVLIALCVLAKSLRSL